MSEGGLFSWKIQKAKNSRGPVADYSSMTLPQPPSGQVWHQDKVTKEYTLVSAATAKVKPLVSRTSAATTSAKRGEEQQQQQQQEPQKQVVLDFAAVGDASERSVDDWDLLSDRISKGGGESSQRSNSILGLHGNNQNVSNNNNHQDAVFVPKAGSVRSIHTLDHASESAAGNNNNNNNSHNSHSNTNRSFKILQRTHSNSTIDSNEGECGNGVVGPSGKGILGVDYVEHVILPSTDTLQGICLAYKISMTRLRQANHFSGNSLLLAPKKLVIPISKKALQSGFIRVQDTDAKEYKIYSFLAEFPSFGMTEAKAYLELSDWDLKAAIRSAKEDVEWEQEMDGAGASALKSGEIRITASSAGGLQTQGAGIAVAGASSSASKKQQHKTTMSTTTRAKKPNDDDDNNDPADSDHSTSNDPAATAPTRRPIVYAPIPAIATKSVQPQDVYQAAPQHDNYGVELKPIGCSSSSSSSSSGARHFTLSRSS